MFQVKARPGPFPIPGKNAHKVWWKWGREWVTQSRQIMFQNLPTSKVLYNIRYVLQSIGFPVVPLLSSRLDILLTLLSYSQTFRKPRQCYSLHTPWIHPHLVSLLRCQASRPLSSLTWPTAIASSMVSLCLCSYLGSLLQIHSPITFKR